VERSRYLPAYVVVTCLGALVVLGLCLAPTVQAAPGPTIQEAYAKLREYGSAPTRSARIPDRCATPIFQTVATQRNLLTPDQRRFAKPFFQRPSEPGGGPWYTELPLSQRLETIHFVFHYTTRGRDAVPMEDVEPQNGVPDYVDIVADAFERSYHFEIEVMGFRKPLDDYWGPDNEGDTRWDVYLFNAPFLGVTVSEWFDRVLPTAVTASLWFAINSKMYEYFGQEEGKRYVETTCAHEFLHSSQYAYNAKLPAWVAESTATWMESRVYDGGLVDDGDHYDDPDELGETNGVDQVYQQIRQWFIKPDLPLDQSGGHAYGNVIFINYLTQRFGYDFIRDLYEAFTDGGSREFGNYWDLLATHSTNWVETFKTFTVWNYFTAERAGLFPGYRDAARYPPIGVNPTDIHASYPAFRFYDEHAIPDAMGSRYVVFDAPTDGIDRPFSIKVRGANVDELIAAGGLIDFTDGKPDRSYYQRWLQIVGLRGWAAPIIIEKRNGEIVRDEIFTYHFSQEGQKDFPGFGSDIRRIVLILANIRPDTVERGNYISYAAGPKPRGRISNVRAVAGATGGVQLTWQLDDLTDTRELYVIRKRYSPYDGDSDSLNFRNAAEVMHAGDRDGNSIPDAPVNIVAKIRATDTSYTDTTTYSDVFTASPNFNPTFVRYYYAVVPVDGRGVMGEPAIASDGVTPIPPAAPAFMVATRTVQPGLWNLAVRSTEPLIATPTLRVTLPDGSTVDVELNLVDGTLWQGDLVLSSFALPGEYRYSVRGVSQSGAVGDYVVAGGTFRYAPSTLKPKMQLIPNRVHHAGDGDLHFYPRGMRIRIYTMTGQFVRELDPDSKWNLTNASGEQVGNGVYMYVAEDGKGFRETGRLVVTW